MTVSVIVPTWKRPGALAGCLDGLARQTVPAHQVLIGVRDDDHATHALIAGRDAARRPVVVPVGQADASAARNLCLRHASGEIVAFIDDDAVPRPRWIEAITACFEADSTLGGVGGPDWQDGTDRPASPRPVGVVQWFGRKIGNHHLGSDRALSVDWLKGANMSFRRKALHGVAFGWRLRGRTTQFAEDLAVSSGVRRRGWNLRYDPAVAVDHYPAEVQSELDHRLLTDPASLEDAAHNDAVATLNYLPAIHRTAYRLWAALVGTRQMPGSVLAFAMAVARRDREPLRRAAIVRRGHLAGVRSWRTLSMPMELYRDDAVGEAR